MPAASFSASCFSIRTFSQREGFDGFWMANLFGLRTPYPKEMMAAPDPVGCWGAAELMRNEYGLTITALTGPATDNEVGRDYIRAELQLPAHNARRDAEGLVAATLAALEARSAAAPLAISA